MHSKEKNILNYFNLFESERFRKKTFVLLNQHVKYVLSENWTMTSSDNI